MVTKIPDGILEKLYCDACYKFLSVKPVKVFPGKKIKCGRCSNNGEDEGVVSLYELIADQYYFPCVNRYDGCDVLLASSQVAAHEENCESRHYVCPICEDEARIPTFLMIKHFGDRHRSALLNTSVFCMDPRESLQVEKWFLYKLENKLFFINCVSKESEYTVSLSARYLGVLSESEIITQKFILHYGSNRVITEETLCLPHSETNTMGFTVSMSSSEQKELITDVNLEINISRLLLPKIPTTHQVQCDSVIDQQATILKETLGENGTRMNASLIDMDLGYSEDDLIRPRMIFLDSELRRQFSLGPTFDYCINNKNENIFLHCFKCKELDYSVFYNSIGEVNYVDIIISNENIYLRCKNCYICSHALGLLSSYMTTRLYFDFFKFFQLFCIWNCNKYIPITNVQAHNMECKKQPFRLCPVKSCKMKGKLSEIKTHFEEHSPEYALSFDSSVDVQLSLSKPIIKQFLMVRHNVFVYVKLTFVAPLWHMKFKLCGKKDTFAGMKLKAMAFDSSSGDKFLGLVEQPHTLEFPHMESVQIKCILEK